MTILIEPGKNTQISNEFSVAEDEIKIITIYTEIDNVTIPAGVVFDIKGKTPAGFFQDVFDPQYGELQLSRKLPNIILSMRGDYKIYRRDITEFGVNVGCAVE